MIYRVRHVTAYSYEHPVEMATHMLHLLPRPLPHQRVMRAELRAEPEAARTTSGRDHFGNEVCWMSLDRPHRRFEVVGLANKRHTRGRHQVRRA